MCFCFFSCCKGKILWCLLPLTLACSSFSFGIDPNLTSGLLVMFLVIDFFSNGIEGGRASCPYLSLQEFLSYRTLFGVGRMLCIPQQWFCFSELLVLDVPHAAICTICVLRLCLRLPAGSCCFVLRAIFFVCTSRTQLIQLMRSVGYYSLFLDSTQSSLQLQEVFDYTPRMDCAYCYHTRSDCTSNTGWIAFYECTPAHKNNIGVRGWAASILADLHMCGLSTMRRDAQRTRIFSVKEVKWIRHFDWKEC